MIKMILALAILLLGIANVLADDAAAIHGLLANAFDKPEARLVVDPVVVAGDYAIAGWSQGRTGTRCAGATDDDNNLGLEMDHHVILRGIDDCGLGADDG